MNPENKLKWFRFFQPQRMASYLQFELISGGKLLFGLLFASPVLYFAFGTLRLLRGGGFDSWPIGWFGLSNLLAVGLASLAFARENASSTGAFYLMIPASHIEKYAAKWIFTFVFGFFVPLLSFTAFANVLMFLGLATKANELNFIFPSQEIFSSTLGIFAVFHAIFFCGSAFFKKNVIPKTLFSMGLYGFVVSFVGMIFIASGLISREMQLAFSEINGATVELTLGRVGTIARLSFLVLLPFFLYVAAYLRLEEIEVSS
jgi:hypothetical protein